MISCLFTQMIRVILILFVNILEMTWKHLTVVGKAYEVIQKGFSKATACQFIMEKYGLDASRAHVFGDSSNDLAMFKYAEHAIAMGRHDSVLDPHAEFVTKQWK